MVRGGYAVSQRSGGHYVRGPAGIRVFSSAGHCGADRYLRRAAGVDLYGVRQPPGLSDPDHGLSGQLAGHHGGAGGSILSVPEIHPEVGTGGEIKKGVL